LESRTDTQVTLDLPEAQAANLSVARISWHGWPDCYLIANGRVEAVVVPAIGRVMQLRLTGEADGAFWENRALDGELHATAPNQPGLPEWINFGGDKCWPAPQSDWHLQQGRDWPPPIAFDSCPMEAVAGEHDVVLTSPVDSAFGIQVTRHVELDAELPVMRIRTEFHKVIGDTVRVSVWTITQMNDPERVFVPLREDSKMPGGSILLIEAEPESLRVEGDLLSLARPRLKSTKIGMDATCMAWVGRRLVVRMDAEAGPGEYPDGGCVTQVYTNPDPVPYVELETLGPLTTMSAGDRIERTTTYTIMPRSTTDPEAEARKILCC
jgi:hypothetical protein